MTAIASPPAGLREDFPVLRRTLDGHPVVYLDNAATSLKPQAVLDAVVHYYSSVGANIHRGKHALSEEASTVYELVRYRVAEFLGAHANEVVFAKNATEALNIVAAGLGLTEDDVVVVPLDAHHSNFLPWADRCRVEIVPLTPQGLPDLERYGQLLAAGPRVVALNHCSNVTGIYSPVREMAHLARQAGATVVIDAAQSAPHRRLDVQDLAADFVAFSAHKMLGPTGLGVLYGRVEAFETLRVTSLGGGTVDWVTSEHFTLRKLPHRFEAGTPDIAAVYGFGAALDYLEDLGMDAVAEHDRRLARVLYEEAAARPYLRVLCSPRHGDGAVDRAAVLSFELPGCPRLGDLARILSDSYGVMCRTGHMCSQPLVDTLAGGQVLRLSAYLYNDEREIQAAFAAVDDTYRRL